MMFQVNLLSINEAVLALVLTLSVIYFVSGLDDTFVDLVAYAFRLKPRRISRAQMRVIDSTPEKRIAVLIPAWDEGNVIDRMIHGNIRRIEYSNYHFFVGVYPNDPLTLQKVQALEKQYSNVHAVVNHKPGPTSKGQILNHVVNQVLAFEVSQRLQFHAFHMQDAEDLVHPKALKLVNSELDRFTFIQIPVFSLEVRATRLVAGTYMDEFAELHTKDILVREKLGAAVPSAGVGTTLSRQLVLQLIEHNRGFLFNEKTLTEDYELGVVSHSLGTRPHFACAYYLPESKNREYIATREFFPKTFSRAIRQKTRWTTGIAIQGWKHLGWRGSLFNRYFLARDRKGILTNFATLLGYPAVLFLSLSACSLESSPWDELLSSPPICLILFANLCFMLNRVVQRALSSYRVYGYRSLWSLLIRWPVGITVNALAGVRSVKHHVSTWFTDSALKWSKTEHELPECFGTPGNNLEIAT